MVVAAGLLGIGADRVEILDHPELQVGCWLYILVRYGLSQCD
jgi:hypothetical protein